MLGQDRNHYRRIFRALALVHRRGVDRHRRVELAEAVEEIAPFEARGQLAGIWVTERHRRTFDTLKDGQYDNFCLFSCYVDGEPATAVAAVSVHEPDGRGEIEYRIHALFVSVSPSIPLTDHDGTEA